MITRYRTQRTTAYRSLRRLCVLFSQAAAKLGSNLGMILRVDILGNVHLAQDWADGLTGKVGFALFDNDDAYGSDPISEQIRCWSHGNRLRLGRLRT
jgi:hypothetical protein